MPAMTGHAGGLELAPAPQLERRSGGRRRPATGLGVDGRHDLGLEVAREGQELAHDALAVGRAVEPHERVELADGEVRYSLADEDPDDDVDEAIREALDHPLAMLRREGSPVVHRLDDVLGDDRPDR